ncbi:hypothetical protein [Burkholderia multivorans]|uniref:hypothetical protein n=1 Tax=Burkholderia multivorans TaxID=87883 RepID=UPI0020199B9B|nr:hypothetical protein [Burkholderia multivorans]MCA8143580.1 hypothetical protein [Burkholderia multivorans]MCO1368588.1 hypothetical protein [Burkholderia multivorans]MCO1380479.1 hypothetical protein [Burkholderia multivorans]MDN8032125.1 hypothetical protein [Burkholderia multivorans]UQP21415.1 hypothetical protein L0Y98_18285 [Burkholderia multivorans]
MEEVLSEAERAAIRAVASGDKVRLPDAGAALNRAAAKHGIAACVEFQFMARSSRAGSGPVDTLAVPCGRVEAIALNKKNRDDEIRNNEPTKAEIESLARVRKPHVWASGPPDRSAAQCRLAPTEWPEVVLREERGLPAIRIYD